MNKRILKINKIERILISPQTSHGHSKNMFAEVRRKSYQKSFSLKINNEFLNTQYVGIVGLSVKPSIPTKTTTRTYTNQFRLFLLCVFLEKSFRVPKVVQKIGAVWDDLSQNAKLFVILFLAYILFFKILSISNNLSI